VCNPGVKAEAVEQEILDQIQAIKEGSITQEELDKVKVNTKADFVYSLERSSDVVSLFGKYLVRGNIKPLLEYEDKLDKITLTDIQEIAKKYFDNNISTTVIVRSAK
jgi:predicted Zn-dependent peptidase